MLKKDKNYIQTCNMLLITFMILFGVFGLLNSSQTNSRHKVNELDRKLDMYEIRLQDYQERLSDYEVQSSAYHQLYEEYESVYNEYMEVYQQRKELYQNKIAEKNMGVSSDVLFMGVGILAVILVASNIWFYISRRK